MPKNEASELIIFCLVVVLKKKKIRRHLLLGKWEAKVEVAELAGAL